VSISPSPPPAACAVGLAASTPHDACILIIWPMPSQVCHLEGLLRAAGYVRVRGSHAPASTAGVRTPFDLILLYLRLPDLQGFETIAPLLDKSRGQQPPRRAGHHHRARRSLAVLAGRRPGLHQRAVRASRTADPHAPSARGPACPPGTSRAPAHAGAALAAARRRLAYLYLALPRPDGLAHTHRSHRRLTRRSSEALRSVPGR